ncbi:MAG TPA: tRNA dihydrouridine synthase DusB [Thermoanaerobaculia bacterium]|nr:tRNA dihydrouridine synthase DusB [Thermoanaerobaculia bacterium]
MLRLGPLSVDPPLFLAPMAGVTDRDFRLIVRRIGGVGVVAMEFVSSRMLLEGDRRLEPVMHFCEEERPLAIQVYGGDAATMAEAARIVEAVGADIVDVNMGCPANKVLRGCAGAALMGDLALARDVVCQVVGAVSIPVTVKFRLGLDERRLRHLELGRICQGEGAAAVALHGRTARQMFSGRADWSEIARLKEALSIPVIGNGDVATADDALAMLAETGCDGVMIGRGATRNPWIFRQIAARRSGGRIPEPTLDDRRRLILDHFSTVIERGPEVHALHKLRAFTNQYSRGLPEGQRLRRRITELREPADFVAAVERHFAELAELERAA